MKKLLMKTFARIAALAAALCLLCAGALADIAGSTHDGYIHRYTAPNGQELYFVSSEEEPIITFDDVNGDGAEDIAVMTAMGASNAYYDFFLNVGGSYEYASSSFGSAVNYTLTDDGYLLSWANNGSAGALFEARLCRWEGTELRAVRTMTGTDEQSYTFENGILTETTDTNRWHVTVYGEGGGAVIWEAGYDGIPENAAEFDAALSHLRDGL